MPDETRSYRISRKLVFSLRPLIMGLSLSVVVLTMVLGWLGVSYMQTRSDAEQLSAEVVHLQRATSSLIEAKLDALSSSEQSVAELQDYLTSRGVKATDVDFAPRSVVTAFAGGPVVGLEKPIPYVGEFDEQTRVLLNQAKRIPLGRPHPGKLTSKFGYRNNPFGLRRSEMHGGLDFRGKSGEPVFSTAAGKVIRAGVAGGYGNLVVVQHGYGYETRYAHLSKITVKVGDTLEAGNQVGLLGSTGRSTGPHLHYEVRRNGELKDPQDFLSIA